MNIDMARSAVVATHLNAYLRGHDVVLDWNSHPALQDSIGTTFTVPVSGGVRQIADVNDWFKFLRDSGFDSAILWLEDLGSPLGTAILGFSGRIKAAPVSRMGEAQVIWHSWRVNDAPNLRGAQIMPGQESVTATPLDALQTMVRSLMAQRELAASEPHTRDWAEFFGRAEDVGRRMLVGEQVEVHEHAEAIFPSGIYPRRSIELAYLVGSSWALYGMGSWNDVSFNKPGSNGLLDELRRDYYLAACKCMYAACDVAV